MIRDRGVHYSKYTVGHIHVVEAGWSTFYKCENIGIVPYSSGFTVQTGFMLEIATLRTDTFIRLFSLCLKTGYRLLKISAGILVRSPILSTLPYDKDLRCPNGWICPYVPPISVALPYAQTPCRSNLSEHGQVSQLGSMLGKNTSN